MNLKYIFQLVSTFLVINTAFAADVLICPQGIELLDHYQGRTLWNHHLLEFKSQKREKLIVEKFFKFQKVDYFMAIRVLRKASAVENDLMMLEKNDSYISDLVAFTSSRIHVNKSKNIPEDCHVEEVSRRHNGQYVFQKEIWKQLDYQTQVSVINSEAIEEFLSALNIKSIQDAQYFNSALDAGELNTVKGYLNVSRRVHFKNIILDAKTDSKIFGNKRLCGLQIYENGFDFRKFVYVKVQGKAHKQFSLRKGLEFLNDGFASRGMCD